MKVNGYEIGPDADLRGADLNGADLSDAVLRDAYLNRVLCSKTKFNKGDSYD